MAMRPASLCSEFQRIANQTWALLASGRRHGLQIPEETITTLNLLRLFRCRSKEFYVRGFTKPQEAVTGADWEWWFGWPGGNWIGCRVQAKVLDLESSRYPYLAHKSGKAQTPQVDLLLMDALRSNPPRFPIYCLYSHWNQKLIRQWGNSCRPPARGFGGCCLSSALEVRSLIHTGHDHIKDLLPFMTPWDEIVCRVALRSDIARTVAVYLRRLTTAIPAASDTPNEIGDIFRRILQVEPSPEIPAYVQAVIQGAPGVESSSLVDDNRLARVTVFATS